MKESQAIELTRMLVAAFPRPVVQPETIRMYAARIVQLDYDATKDAIFELMDEQKWLPSIADIRQRAISRTRGLSTSETAWQNVMAKVASVGSYRTPTFDDPVTECAVAQLGWQYLCNSPVESHTFTRKEFRAAYEEALLRAMRGDDGVSLLADGERRALQGLHEKQEYKSPVIESLLEQKKLKGGK